MISRIREIHDLSPWHTFGRKSAGYWSSAADRVDAAISPLVRSW